MADELVSKEKMPPCLVWRFRESKRLSICAVVVSDDEDDSLTNELYEINSHLIEIRKSIGEIRKMIRAVLIVIWPSRKYRNCKEYFRVTNMYFNILLSVFQSRFREGRMEENVRQFSSIALYIIAYIIYLAMFIVVCNYTIIF